MILLIWLMLFWSYFTHLSAELQIRQIGLVPWESQRELLQPAGKWGSEPTEHEDFTITNQFLLHCVSVILFHQDNVFFLQSHRKKNSQICICRKVDWTNHSQLHCESLKTNFDQHKLENHWQACIIPIYSRGCSLGKRYFACKVRKHGGTHEQCVKQWDMNQDKFDST
jgi:hypothetical protein